MNDNKTSKTGLFEKITIFFSCILVLQTLTLIILMIQLSDSKAFRIAIGFCGTGIAVVSIVMGMITLRENKSWNLPYIKDVNKNLIKYLWLLTLIYTVINLAYKFYQNYLYTHSLYLPAIYTGTLVLSTSLLAFIIVGLKVLIKNPEKSGYGFIIARIGLVLFFFWMFYKIYQPIFLILLIRVSHNTIFINYIENTPFNLQIIAQIPDVVSWHFSALLAFISQYRFYLDFIWKPNITDK